jgi:cytochrome P450
MSTVSPEPVAHTLPDVDFGTDELPNFHALMDQLRATGRRVFPVRYIGGTAWLLLRHGDVYRAFRDSEHFPSSASYTRIAMPTMGRTIQCIEGEEHRIKRALVSSAFTPAAVRAAVERLLRPLANQLIDGWRGRHGSGGLSASRRAGVPGLPPGARRSAASGPHAQVAARPGDGA